MNIKKSKQLLKKINKLHEALSEEGTAPTRMERDLMLSYLRDMYDVVITDKNQIFEADAELDRAIAREESRQEVHEQPATPAPIQYAAAAPVAPPAKSYQAQPTAYTNGTSAYVAEPEVEEISDAMSRLFADQKISDLSDRLSHTKVSDLSRGMGLNEKIFTIQELFGGDNELFEKTVFHLNSFSRFEEAKAYLAKDVAQQMDWASENKYKKAVHFIKYVRRRYV